MKREFFAVDFYATETLQNGNERETTQTVYFPKREENGKYTNWNALSVIERAKRELENDHFYRLLYKKTRIVKMSVIM